MTDDGWTVQTLKHLVETMLAERDARWRSDQEAMLRAVNKADEALERRLELLNEFRQQAVKDQTNFVSRSEFESLEKRYEDRHEQIQIDVRLLQARIIPILWVGGVIVISLIGVFVSHITTGNP